MLCIWTNVNVIHDLLPMLAKPANVIKAFLQTLLLGDGGGVDDNIVGVDMSLLEALIFFSTNVAMRSATLLIFLLQSSLA